MPLAARTARPVAILRLRPATRTMKNSSRLLVKIARKRARSSRGRLSSSASSSTRSLKRSHDSSRSTNRLSTDSMRATSAGSGVYDAAAVPSVTTLSGSVTAGASSTAACGSVVM